MVLESVLIFGLFALILFYPILCVRLLTLGSFMLTFGAFLLTLGAFLLTLGAHMLTLGAFMLGKGPKNMEIFNGVCHLALDLLDLKLSLPMHQISEPITA